MFKGRITLEPVMRCLTNSISIPYITTRGQIHRTANTFTIAEWRKLPSKIYFA